MEYRIISADSHVNPLPTFWQDYLPARFRDDAPRLESTDEGDFVVFEGTRRPFGILSSLAGKKREDYKTTGTVAETRAGGWDPTERLKDLALDNVDAEVLFGGGPLATSNLELQHASFRAYNTWLGDYCAAAPEKLFGMAYIPTSDVAQAVDELVFAARRGLRGVVVSAFPPASHKSEGGGLSMGGDQFGDRQYGDAEFDPLWRAAIEHNLPINVHLGARRADLRPNRFLSAMMGSKVALSEVIANFVFGGVLQRYPELKLVSVEGGVGWFAFAAQYMDHVWERHRFWTGSDLKEPPSFYMDRQVYGTVLDDKVGVKLRHEPGAKNIMWSSDYPHSETTWPDSMKSIEEHFAGVPADETYEMTCGIVSRLLGLNGS